MKIAFIFPAFVSEYIGSEIEILHGLSNRFQQHLNIASKTSGIDFTKFHLKNVEFTTDELKLQLISYIFSCSLSDELISRNLKPELLAGYSMGLYAALYTGRAITFEEGIQLIVQAFTVSKAAIEDIDAGMGSIIGLKADEINEIIINNKLKAEIANTNSQHSHLVTGHMDDIRNLLDSATETGALHVATMNVKTPYHSEMLGATRKPFDIYISEKITLKDAIYPILSAIDQRIIRKKLDIRRELTDNLSRKINWMASFSKMQELGITDFIECGAGKSLQKISRFHAGGFKIYPMNRLERLLDQYQNNR